METVQIPFVAKDLAILICNSNVRHELSDSEYPTRRKQCTKAKELMGLNSYRDATESHLSGEYFATKVFAVFSSAFIAIFLTILLFVSFFLFVYIFIKTALNQEEEILLKRARHVITEIKRTNEAAEALRQHNFKKVSTHLHWQIFL